MDCYEDSHDTKQRAKNKNQEEMQSQITRSYRQKTFAERSGLLSYISNAKVRTQSDQTKRNKPHQTTMPGFTTHQRKNSECQTRPEIHTHRELKPTENQLHSTVHPGQADHAVNGQTGGGTSSRGYRSRPGAGHAEIRHGLLRGEERRWRHPAGYLQNKGRRACGFARVVVVRSGLIFAS